jgi:hypothetical protein
VTVEEEAVLPRGMFHVGCKIDTWCLFRRACMKLSPKFHWISEHKMV